MNAKKFINYVIVMLMFSSCCSCGKHGDSNIIERNSRATGKLETTVTELDRATADSRERIRNALTTSRNIEDGIERIEYLFEQYEFEVGKLQDEIDRIRDEIKGETKKDY